MRSRFSHFIILDSGAGPEKLADASLMPKQWRSLLNLGIAFLISGIIAISLPQFITIAINLIFGILLMLIGLATAMYAYSVRLVSYDRWPLFTSIILLICGLLLLLFPKIGAVSITLVIAIFLIFTGMGKIALAQLIPPHTSRLWIYISGFIDLALCFLIFFNLSEIADWFLGLVLGISLIMQGLWNIRLALSLRKSSRNVFEAL